MRLDRVAVVAEMARRDLSVGKLAELAGVSRTTVTAVRSGKGVSKFTAEQLASVLGNQIIKPEE